jgi:hypothetical protein
MNKYKIAELKLSVSVAFLERTRASSAVLCGAAPGGSGERGEKGRVPERKVWHSMARRQRF